LLPLSADSGPSDRNNLTAAFDPKQSSAIREDLSRWSVKRSPLTSSCRTQD